MENYFDYLPHELIINVMKFMRLQDKEHFTRAYPEYYIMFKERKRRFLEENYQINYRPLVKKGIDFYVEHNKICIHAMLRKKRFYIDCYPDIIKKFFISYDTPIIPYKCKFRSKANGIFHCDTEDLKHRICVGKYPAISAPDAKKFMFIKTKDNKVISVWEREVYGGWDCYFEDSVYNIVGRYYINFGIIERIIESM